MQASLRLAFHTDSLTLYLCVTPMAVLVAQAVTQQKLFFDAAQVCDRNRQLSEIELDVILIVDVAGLCRSLWVTVNSWC